MNRNPFVFLLLFLICVPFFAGSKNKPGEYKPLSAPNPSPEAKAVYEYMQDMFGEKILSGQMSAPWGIDELEYVKKVTDKQPAIRGIDFIHESDNEMETQNAIDWWNAGGIPTIMWHWGAPSVGEGYENSKMKIDIKQCFVEGTPENIAMWEELKIKADHLEKLRDAHVPVLWRPFHELNGNWFWWGKEGPEMFVKLWQTMYKYYVNERNLNNLIWVLCYTGHPDASWYPGNEYVDVVGADVYGEGSDPHKKMFNQVVKIAGDNMTPVAYHECGTIPDPDACKETGAMWSWWMEWHTSHLTEMDSTYLRNVYNHDLVVTRDEIPNLMAAHNGNQENQKTQKIVDDANNPFADLKTYNFGKQTKPGNATLGNNNLEILASGSDIWGTSDEGYFAFKTLKGNFDFRVRVKNLTPADLYTKAGIMARADLRDGAEHVYFQVFPDNRPRNKNNGGCEFQYRKKTSAEMEAIYPDQQTAGNEFNVEFPNTWIRLKREGDEFTAYFSTTKGSWNQYATHRQKMPKSLLVGLAVTSHNPNGYTRAEFADLEIETEK